jgi:hypothetical protein
MGAYFLRSASAPFVEHQMSHVFNSIADHEQPLRPLEEQAKSFTRREFCLLEKMSSSTYYKLKQMGLGPQEVRFPGMAFARITPQARREWHEKIEAWHKSKEARVEEQRRSAATSAAGKAAAASPLHVSKRGPRTVKRARMTAKEKSPPVDS